MQEKYNQLFPNRNGRVVTLVLTCFFVYFAVSVFFHVFQLSWEPFDRINLISEVFKSASEVPNPTKKNESEKVVKENSLQDFELYKKSDFITNFYTGDSICALPHLAKKLEILKNGGNAKIKIAYFGDSMIEGDLLTQTFRKLLQTEYGGFGVGFLPITSVTSGFRKTASNFASDWNSINFMSKGAKNMYISGYAFTGAGSATFRDNTINNDKAKIEKYLIYGSGNDTKISYNDQNILLNESRLVNKKLLSNDLSHSIKLKSNSENTPFYGVSFESERGVFVDNFSFRGITGVEFKKIDEDFLEAVQEANQYDLIIFQYGVNLLFRPNDTNYDYYITLINPVIKKMKKAFPNADFLLVSGADRAFRYNGEYKSAIGIHELIKTQAKIAYDHKLAFYNQFESMGGENSIVKWATQNPALANKDYVHPNEKGSDILAEKLFHAILKDSKKYRQPIPVSK